MKHLARSSPTRANATPVPGGASAFRRIFTRLGCTGRPPEFRVQFHPYSSLTHTIRLRDEAALVRLSDMLRGMSAETLEAVAAILLGQLYRRTPPASLVRSYRAYVASPAMRRHIERIRRQRVRHAPANPRGDHHDLAAIYERLNRRFFRRKMKRPRLGWSSRPWTRQMGCYDGALRQILLNRRLDHPAVPDFAVAYVLYHEMLHQKHPLRLAHCRLQSHSPEFRREEKRFEQYEEALLFLRRLA